MARTVNDGWPSRGWSRREGAPPLARPAPWREPQPSILIVCEGKKTEPYYFSALRSHRRLPAARIEIVPGDITGSDPRRIVRFARDMKRRRRRMGAPLDRVWCVFDRDEHPGLDEAFAIAERHKIEIAFSNPCFELWYLIHFEDVARPMHRDAVTRRLWRRIPGYGKASPVYHSLLPRQAEAIRRAERMREALLLAGLAETKNPSTNADELVGYLNSLSGERAAG